MNWWWRKEIDVARERADRAEQERLRAVLRRRAAERADSRIEKVGEELRRDIVRNGYAEALRKAFGSPA